MTRFTRTTAETVANLKQDYLNTVTAPLDGMWESGFLPFSNHWEISIDQKQAGYFCVNNDGVLLQLHLKDTSLANAIPVFEKMINEDFAGQAIAGTNEPLYLSLCLDQQKSIAVHTFLFEQDKTNGEVIATTNYQLKLATREELSALLAFVEESVGGGDWLEGYMSNLIKQEELFFMAESDTILATGECRISKTQLPFADLGMIVNKSFRGRNIATTVLKELKSRCIERRLTPICSTTVENIAAQKAIKKAGFVSRHRLLEVQF